MNGNKTTATSSEERRMQRGISVLAFFVPAFIMLVLFLSYGAYILLVTGVFCSPTCTISICLF